MIPKDQYKRILLQQMEETKLRRIKEKQDRLGVDDPGLTSTFNRKRGRSNSRLSQDSLSKNKPHHAPIPLSPRVFNHYNMFHKRSKSLLDPDKSLEFYQPKPNKGGRNLLLWQNVDQQTIEENENKKKVMREWLTSQINENRIRKFQSKQKQKADKPKIQQIFKFSEQKVERPRVKRKICGVSELVQQKEPEVNAKRGNSNDSERYVRNKTEMSEVPQYRPRRQMRMNTVSEMEDIAESKISFLIEDKISVIRKQLEEQKAKHSLEIQEVRAEAFKVKKEKQNLEQQFNKLRKFVQRKLVKKPKAGIPKEKQEFNQLQYTFQESAPKSNFFNESILNSSKQIEFCETELIPFSRKSSQHKGNSNNILDSSQSLSHLELSSSLQSLRKTHITQSQYLDKN